MKLKWVATVVLAFMLLASAPVMAQMGGPIISQAPAPVVAQVPLKPTAIPQFTQELPRLTLDSSGIPVVGGAAVSVSMCEFETSILPPLTPLAAPRPGYTAGKTQVWGYLSPDCSNPAGSYIGPVILASRGTPTEVTYINNLPDASQSKVLAYAQSTDQTLQWADPYSLRSTPNADGTPDFLVSPPEENDCNHEAKNLVAGGLLPSPCGDNYGFWLDQGTIAAPLAPPVRRSYSSPIPAAPHLHGGEIPAMLDGGPDAWWTPDGIKGHGYYTKDPALTPDNAAIYTYPNVQDPAPTWFHDHVLGATRLNVYAGIAGAYYQIEDTASFPLPAGMWPVGLTNGAPDAGGAATNELLIPLVIQDRMFDSTGQLLFPNIGLNAEHPYWVPEFVGDVIVVNGKSWPKVTVEPKRYRFLVLNGSNARTYELFLINPVTQVKGPGLWVIGNDQGYLDATVELTPKAKKANATKLTIMPGERYEIIIDFANLPAGTVIEMRNTAKTPYPGGAPSLGQTTGKILQFRVTACTSGFCGETDGSFNPAPAGKLIRAAADKIVQLRNPLTGLPLANVQKTRRLTLNEFIGAGGPLEILVNNTTYLGKERGVEPRSDFTGVSTQWNTTYYSELPHEGETEIWEIVNITADAHPIHPHLVAFQILNREAFNLKGFDAAYNLAFPGGVYIPGIGPPLDYNCGAGAPGRGALTSCVLGGNPDITPFLSGVVQPPLPFEQGWKDTAISYPGEVLRLMIRFAPTGLPADTPPDKAHYDFSPNGGHGYVWHCHIIDHEDNEMMRPFSVYANSTAVCDPAIAEAADPNFCQSPDVETRPARLFVKGVDY